MQTALPQADLRLRPSPRARAELGALRVRDYESLPDEPRQELIYGRYALSPAPLVRHQLVVALLWQHLERTARDSGGLVLPSPVDVVLAEHSVVQPDVLYVTRARRGIVKDRVEGAPDLVIEVVSPGTASSDRGEKLQLYAESGVREYWIVEPAERLFEFLSNEGGRFVVLLADDAGVYRSPALEGVGIDLGAFWTEVDARLP